MKCRICGSVIKTISVIPIPEKMYGIHEKFNYLHCYDCNCLQIEKIPDNLSIYYPANYYSYSQNIKPELIQKLNQHILNTLSIITQKFYKKPSFINYGINYDDRKKSILDVGSGTGAKLIEFKKWGFKNITGIDPFIEKDIKEKRLNIYKKNIDQITGQFDIIMSHHSLEHMQNPNLLFKKVKEILKSSGRFILRTPIFPNYIWDKYKEHWIQLDAPRHLYIFSLKTLRYLCQKNGLKIKETKFDSHPWSLASTEYCLNGKTHREFEKNVQITPEQVIQCKEANLNNNGDSVCLIITHDNY